MATPKKSKAKDLVKPYERTPQEIAIAARYDKRRLATPTLPPFKCEMGKPDANGKRAANISVDHPDLETGYRIIADALGTGDRFFTAGFMCDLTGLVITSGAPDMSRANYAMSIVKGIKPRDTVEALLASQMAAVHLATMREASFLGASVKAEGIDAYERGLNRLSRTFAAQVEALKRYRSKGTQRVIVERVNVEPGGQAIVGDVHRHGDGGGGGDETGG